MQSIKSLHVLSRSIIFFIRIAVDIFGLHLGEPDASGSFFVNYEIEERGILYRMVRDVQVFAHPFLYTQTAGIKVCRREDSK